VTDRVESLAVREASACGCRTDAPAASPELSATDDVMVR
jgi:hypothetical protein